MKPLWLSRQLSVAALGGIVAGCGQSAETVNPAQASCVVELDGETSVESAYIKDMTTGLPLARFTTDQSNFGVEIKRGRVAACVVDGKRYEVSLQYSVKGAIVQPTPQGGVF